ncbi:unnamed protein product [Meganyctiphanes norvegica]|uniref:Reverse transcriptase zinc-binding domain-containing protein n=1 Tax=Meganyctiphanes norvegica TaxID=48144 RepID=A0AAV2SVU9_MEGNR
MYETFKKEVKEENIYRNDFSSILLFQARTNSLPLADEKSNKNKSHICEICKNEEEDIKHFLFRCKITETVRKKFIKEIKKDDEEAAIKDMLFNSDNTEKEYLKEIWKERRKNKIIINKESARLKYENTVKEVCEKRNPFQKRVVYC